MQIFCKKKMIYFHFANSGSTICPAGVFRRPTPYIIFAREDQTAQSKKSDYPHAFFCFFIWSYQKKAVILQRILKNNQIKQ